MHFHCVEGNPVVLIKLVLEMLTEFLFWGKKLQAYNLFFLSFWVFAMWGKRLHNDVDPNMRIRRERDRERKKEIEWEKERWKERKREREREWKRERDRVRKREKEIEIDRDKEHFTKSMTKSVT